MNKAVCWHLTGSALAQLADSFQTLKRNHLHVASVLDAMLAGKLVQPGVITLG